MDFLYKKTSLKPAAQNISQGMPTGFWENFGAAFDEQEAIGNSFAEENNVRAAVAERTKTIEEAIGGSYSDFLTEHGISHKVGISTFPGDTNFDEYIRPRLPESIRDIVLSGKQLQMRGKELALEVHDKAQDVRRRAGDGFGNTAASLLGTMSSGMLDPVNLGTMLFNPVGGVLKKIATEVAIGTLSEGLIQLRVQGYREELGLDHGFLQGVEAAALAGAGAGALRGTFEGVGAVFGLAKKQKVLADAKEHIKNPTAEQQASMDVLEADIANELINPLKDTPAGRAQHADNMDIAKANLANDVAVKQAVNDSEAAFDATNPHNLMPAREPVIEAVQAAGDDANADLDAFSLYVDQLAQFEIADIKTDAKLFQFKADGDAAGVTDRLVGVDYWDATLSGKAFIYENLAGERYIVDGHQRLALAQRIAKADPNQHPKLDAYLLREADGWTPEKARTRAAQKNIIEGTGTAIDAAKILRGSDVDLPLPPRSALVKDARGLAALSDDAFLMAVNELVRPKYAALVGKIALKPDSHANIIKFLRELKPANAIEAELIVRDAIKAPQIEQVQTDMFGEIISSMPLLKERAQVMSRAIAQIKKDRSVFKVMVTDKARIGEAGNKLDAVANTARLSDDEMILLALEKLGNMKGGISDALDAAAKDLNANPKSGKPVANFVDILREFKMSEANVIDLEVPPTAKQIMDDLEVFGNEVAGMDEAALRGMERELRRDADVNGSDEVRDLFTDIDKENGFFDDLAVCAGGGV